MGERRQAWVGGRGGMGGGKGKWVVGEIENGWWVRGIMGVHEGLWMGERKLDGREEECVGEDTLRC